MSAQNSDPSSQRPTLSAPPGPIDDSSEGWSAYRADWERYLAEWNVYWRASGQAKRPLEARDGGPDFREAESAYLDNWKFHWETLRQPWRVMPEIGEERQTFLRDHRNLRAGVTDTEVGAFPFEGVSLTLDDVEWLLATHEDGRGPVLWDEEEDKGESERRKGLDLRRADLQGLDLSILPLTGMLGGSAHLEGADLSFAHPEGADLREAHLEGARLEWANIQEAHLEGADLSFAHLEGADLREAHLEAATLFFAHLERADLRRAFFDSAADMRLAFIGYSNTGENYASVADVRWGGVILGGVWWPPKENVGARQETHGEQDKPPQTKAKRAQVRGSRRRIRQLSMVKETQVKLGDEWRARHPTYTESDFIPSVYEELEIPKSGPRTR